MNPTNNPCTCVNCPGEGCQCGCQATVSTLSINYAGLRCACGPSCGCDGAEQGCLCQQ
jgi:hypothetical protein